MGLAAAAGGSWHALFSHRPGPAADLLWKGTLAAAGLADFNLIAGVAFASVRRSAAKWIAAAAAAKLVIFLFSSLPADSFTPVVVDSAVTLATILVLQSLALAKWRAASSPWILAGVAVSAAAAAIEALRPPLPVPFGPDAVYHLVQLVGLFLFYRGALLFVDR